MSSRNPSHARYDYDPSDSETSEAATAEFYEERDVLRPGQQALGLMRAYVPWWEPRHGIREFYQNWKDAIKETSSLYRREVSIVSNGFNARNVYTVEARHPDTKKLLGYIRWEKGCIEFTNFGAQLHRETLNLGATTKRTNKALAGKHGEGFKVGALVMVRQGYAVRYEASEFYWSFVFGGRDGDQFMCRLSRMSPAKLNKLKEAHQSKSTRGVPRQLTANIWEDVSVKIGRFGGKGTVIERSEFESWIKVSLDLDYPSTIINTPHGSLILDKNFKGNIYLKGLLIEESSSAKDFKYGYNLLTGEVNRDRERLRYPKKEAKMMGSIWEEAMKTHGAVTLAKYVNMLQADELFADVEHAEVTISEFVANKIWKHLLSQNVDGNRFFHCIEHGDSEVELITKSLKKDPYPLKKTIWTPLRRYSLVRTAEEQMCHLLEHAPSSSQQQTTYSDGVVRMLKSALALDDETRALKLDFRDGSGVELDLLLKGDSLVINDKWLVFESSHVITPCSLSAAATAQNVVIGQFTCCHILTQMYDLVLVELTKKLGHRQTQSIQRLRSIVNEELNQMPCQVDIKQGKEQGQLDVSWLHLESTKASELFGLDLKGRVILHRESTCSARKYDLLGSDAYGSGHSSQSSFEEADSLLCSCPQELVALRDCMVTFSDLDPIEEYFPVVSRTGAEAFCAIPPKAISPNAPSAGATSMLNSVSGSSDIISCASSNNESKSRKTECDLGDLYGATPEINYHNDGDENNDEADGDDGKNMPMGGLRLHASNPNTNGARRSQRMSELLSPRSTTSDAPSSRKDDLEIARLKAELALLSEKLDCRDREVQDLTGDLEVTRQRLSEVQRELDLSSQEIRRLQPRIDELIILLQDTDAITDQVSANTETKVSGLEAELRSRNSTIQTLSTRIHKMERVIKELETDQNEQSLELQLAYEAALRVERRANAKRSRGMDDSVEDADLVKEVDTKRIRYH